MMSGGQSSLGFATASTSEGTGDAGTNVDRNPKRKNILAISSPVLEAKRLKKQLMALPKRSAKGKEANEVEEKLVAHNGENEDYEVPHMLAAEWASRARFERTRTLKNISVAIWREAKQMAEVQAACGPFVGPMGVSVDGVEWLNGEEAMYLVEKRELEIFCPGEKIPLSVQQARVILLKSVPAEIYMTYGYLKRLGFVVRRHKTDEWYLPPSKTKRNESSDFSSNKKNRKHDMNIEPNRELTETRSDVEAIIGLENKANRVEPLAKVEGSQHPTELLTDRYTRASPNARSTCIAHNLESNVLETTLEEMKSTEQACDISTTTVAPKVLSKQEKYRDHVGAGGYLCPDNDVILHLDVWNTTSTFKRSNPCRPSFVVQCILYHNDPLTRTSLRRIRETCDGIPVRVAAVSDGIVMFFSTLFKGAHLEY
eukprot:CFRG4932T1